MGVKSKNLAKGFSMLEVLVTLMLSVIVVSLTLQIIGTLRPKHLSNDDIEMMPQWITPLLTQVKQDFAHAIQVKTGPHQLVLITRHYLEPKTLRVSHRPAEVIYQIKQWGQIYTLSRKQRLIGKLNNGSSLNQLIAMHVTDFKIKIDASRGSGLKALPDSYELELSYQIAGETHTFKRTIIR